MFEKGSRKEGRFERNGGPKYRANLLVRYLTTSAVPYILDLPPPPPPLAKALFLQVLRIHLFLYPSTVCLNLLLAELIS